MNATPPPPDTRFTLCLSGAGHRALMFQVGAVWRLHEAGLLARIGAVQAVSGGAIVAAWLALRWAVLRAGAGSALFQAEFARPLRALAARTFDGRSVVGSVLFAGGGNEWFSHNLERALYQGAQLRDLPADAPRLVLGAARLADGRSFHADSSVPGCAALPLARCVAAAAALPPQLSPAGSPFASPKARGAGALLTDGAACDPLATAPADGGAAALLVSDGGGPYTPPEPNAASIGGSAHAIDLRADLARRLAKHMLLERLRSGALRGTYWGLESDMGPYPADTTLVCPPARARALLAIPARYAALEDGLQEHLINWGYAICDIALRSHVAPDLPLPRDFPYRDRGL
jgi:NTE family protein